jgi:hypothetical protein
MLHTLSGQPSFTRYQVDQIQGLFQDLSKTGMNISSTMIPWDNSQNA